MITPKSNSSSRKSRKATISRSSLNKLQKGSALLQKAFSVKDKAFKESKKTRKRKRIQYQNRPYNVSASRDITSKTYKKQRVSKKQQRIINRRFKNGYSPFIDRVKNSLQLTENKPNLAKWIWRTGNNFKLIRKAFAHYPASELTAGGKLESISQFYLQSAEQSIYFSQIKYIYELRNPNNYDIVITIYDIVYKEDSEDQCNNNVFISETSPPNPADNGDDPIRLIARGIDSVTGYLEQDTNITQNSSAVVVADPNSLSTGTENVKGGFGDVLLKPTDSYPFNIYCKILKKRIYRLEPGATMTHIFTYKPKALLNRGYVGYKYKKQYQGTAATNNIAVGNFTCGCLFKVTGQVLNSGNDIGSGVTVGEVGYYSGNIALVETIENKWYAIDDKFNYIFNENNLWTPTAEEYASATNPTDVNMETVDEASTTTGT